MCTLAIYVAQFPDLPLVVAANRDEFFERPATAPLLLGERPRVVGGRDLRAGGTWLGLTEHGLVGGILNRRADAPPVPSKRSRGLLLMEALGADSAAAAERLLAAADPAAYNAFTLLVADRERALVAQNLADRMQLTRLGAGVHVLSNLDLGDPTCPKVARSSTLFAAAADALRASGDREAFRAALARILADHACTSDPRLPDDALGALCVHTERFGTRCSSLALLDARGRWQHWFADGPPCRVAYQPALAP